MYFSKILMFFFLLFFSLYLIAIMNFIRCMALLINKYNLKFLFAARLHVLMRVMAKLNAQALYMKTKMETLSQVILNAKILSLTISPQQASPE